MTTFQQSLHKFAERVAQTGTTDITRRQLTALRKLAAKEGIVVPSTWTGYEQAVATWEAPAGSDVCFVSIRENNVVADIFAPATVIRGYAPCSLRQLSVYADGRTIAVIHHRASRTTVYCDLGQLEF